MHWWYFGFWSDTHDRVIRCVRTSMPTRVLCFMLVTWEDFTSDDVFAYFFNCFSGKCWSLVTSFLRLDYKQIHVCFVSGPLFSQGASSWIRTGRCGMEPSASSQDVFGLVVCFFYLDGSILIDKGKAMPETHWIHRPGARICGHSTRGVIPFMENGSKLKKSRTLFTSRTYVFPGLPHKSLVRSHLPKVTPSRTWFFDAGVHRYRLSYTLQNITQSFPIILRDIQSSHTGKSVVWVFGSFPEQRLSPSWW